MAPIRKIVILGGGTTGWMCAALIANSISKKRLKIELIESEQIGTIGVGESTIPPMIEAINTLGIDEVDFIKKTQATFKLGIEFTDWKTKGQSYFHPFGSITAGLDEKVFTNIGFAPVLNGDKKTKLLDLSASNIMAKQKRFMTPGGLQGSILEESRYALHLDATLTGQYLRKYAQEKGVKRTEGKVVDVQLHETNATPDPQIKSLTLENGKKIEGDFFIDCSGFQSLLLGQTLNVGYEDWSTYLPCNRAVTALSEPLDELPPYTRAAAQDAGWMWRIPLQQRTGNGYVYASEYISDNEAKETLLNSIEGKVLSEPRIINFTTGMRQQLWKGNCLAIGLAAGFIEPLESTAIHLAIRGATEFLQQFPDKTLNPSLIKEYNNIMRQDYEEIRDFIVLHYATTQRDDTPFWQYCKTMEWPKSLTDAVNYFTATGSPPRSHDPIFEDPNWRCVCEGMGIRPKSHSIFIEDMDYKTMKDHMSQYAKSLNEICQKLPTHREFIEQHCATENEL